MTISLIHSPDYADFHALVGEYVKDPRKLLRLTNSIVDKTNEVVDREVDNALDAATAPYSTLLREQEEELQAAYARLHEAEDRVEYLRQFAPIGPGDRVRVDPSRKYEVGYEGVVLDRKPTNGDDVIVRVDNQPGREFELSYTHASLTRI